MLRERHCKDVAKRIIGDKAYENDPHDEHLRRRFGVELIALHKRNQNVKQLKMAELFAATKEDGKLKDSFPGFSHFNE